MERITSLDQFLVVSETEKAPFNIGALLLFSVPEEGKRAFGSLIRAHLERYVPRTVLARRMAASPEGFDANAWFRIQASKARSQIRTPDFAEELSDAELRDYVSTRATRHLDLSQAPFEIEILDRITGPRCAIYFKMHHGVADGVGFQTLLQSLSDQGCAELTGEAADVDEEIPTPERWLALARERFEREAPFRAQQAEAKAAAQEQLARFLESPEHRRRVPPAMPFGSEISRQRYYRTISFEFAAFRAVAKGLDATINDVFLAVAAGALRSHLLERGQLPDAPLVSHSVRSIRRPEHGPYGNLVLSIFPELATDEPDPLERLRRIQRSMNAEKQRSAIEEDLVDVYDQPFGARDLQAICSTPAQIEAVIGPANVMLSNVPGAERRMTFAGYAVEANYPVPIIIEGRFLNITSRRNANSLDMGLTFDAVKLENPDDLLRHLQEAFEALKRISSSRG